MKILLLLSLLLSLLVPFQGSIVSSDASSLTVANFNWNLAEVKGSYERVLRCRECARGL